MFLDAVVVAIIVIRIRDLPASDQNRTCVMQTSKTVEGKKKVVKE
jgi:hypothetical protein